MGKIFSEAERAELQGLHSEISDRLHRENLIELEAAIRITGRALGKQWLWRNAEGVREMTRHIVFSPTGETRSLPAASPRIQLTTRGSKFDVLVVKVLAGFLADLITSERAVGFRGKLRTLRKQPFYSTFMEVRAAAYFLRAGWRVVFSASHRPRPNGSVMKGADLQVELLPGQRFAVECKRLDFVDGGWNPSDPKTLLRAVREGRDQISESGLPGIVMVQIHPATIPSHEELLPLLEAADRELEKFPSVLGAVLLFDYFIDKGPTVPLGLLHHSSVHGFRNRRADPIIANVLEQLILNVPPPRTFSLLDY